MSSEPWGQTSFFFFFLGGGRGGGEALHVKRCARAFLTSSGYFKNSPSVEAGPQKSVHRKTTSLFHSAACLLRGSKQNVAWMIINFHWRRICNEDRQSCVENTIYFKLISADEGILMWSDRTGTSDKVWSWSTKTVRSERVNWKRRREGWRSEIINWTRRRRERWRSGRLNWTRQRREGWCDLKKKKEKKRDLDKEEVDGQKEWIAPDEKEKIGHKKGQTKRRRMTVWNNE